jgi:alpha-galactosidase
MSSLGLKAAGYQYVNIDVCVSDSTNVSKLISWQDCWSNKNRDSQGRLQADSGKFPNGIASVASKVHALGLKIGIYSDAGTATCAGYPASIGREALDAATWSSWGIDCTTDIFEPTQVS